MSSPKGTCVIRAIAMPENTNANGDIFGGWILSMMDLGGSVIAKRAAKARIVTVAINGMSFLNPVHVGDIVSVYAIITEIGRTSLKVEIETWVERHLQGELLKVTQGMFTYVAIDENRKPMAVKNK